MLVSNNYFCFLEFVNALGEPGDDYDENEEDEEDVYPPQVEAVAIEA